MSDTRKYCVGFVDTRQEIGVWEEIVIVSPHHEEPVLPSLFTVQEAEVKQKELQEQGYITMLFQLAGDTQAQSVNENLRRELARFVSLMEPLECDGSLNIPGLATLNGARAALQAAGRADE